MIITIIMTIMKIPLLGRHGPDPIPVWVLPYGGCRRDPRNPQGAAAVKLGNLKIDLLAAPVFERGGGHLVGGGRAFGQNTTAAKKQKMTLPRSDWGQQVCFQLDKQTNRQVDNGQMVGIYHLTIFPPDQDQPCVFNWSKHKKSNSCWSQQPKFRFEDLASGPSFEIWTKNFQKM